MRNLQTFTALLLLFTNKSILPVFLFFVGRKFQASGGKTVRSKIIKGALFAVMAAGLVAGIAFAENAGPMHRHMRGEFMGGMGFGLPLHQLNLTDEQRAQIKAIFQNEKGNMKPLMQQEMAAHQQFMQLITSGSFDQAKANTIATQEAQTHAQIQVEHAKIGAQIYQLLNSEQKAKVADIMAKRQQRMQEHMQKQQQAPADQQ
jgi:periplasmic protein CpxP/Spy